MIHFTKLGFCFLSVTWYFFAVCRSSRVGGREKRRDGSGGEVEESYKRQCLQFLDSPLSVQNMTLVFEKCCNCNPFNKFQVITTVPKLWRLQIAKPWRLLFEEWAWRITSISSNYSRYDFISFSGSLPTPFYFAQQVKIHLDVQV